MKGVKQSILMISLALTIAVLAGNAAALGFEYYGVEVSISDDLTVNNLIVLNFDTPVNHLDYSLDFRIENLNYDADFDFAECSVADNNGGSTISCDFIGMTPEKNKLTLNFDTRDVITKVDDNYRFTVNYGVPFPIQSSFILIRLPMNNILAGEANESYFPSTGSIISDGRHIMVFWEDDDLPTGENLQFSILFTRPLFTGDFMSIMIYLVAIVAIVVIFLSFVYLRRGRRDKVAVVKSVLNKDEKKIIDILSEHKGKAGQKLLVRETDFSKAKVSRIVKTLKERGVVETEPISGRENRVILRLGADRPPERKEE